MLLQNQDNNEHMAYWLSNTSALVFLIQKSLRPEGSSSARKPPPPTSLFGRMTMVMILILLLVFAIEVKKWVGQDSSLTDQNGDSLLQLGVDLAISVKKNYS